MAEKNIEWYEEALHTFSVSNDQLRKSYMSEHARALVAEAQVALLQEKITRVEHFVHHATRNYSSEPVWAMGIRRALLDPQ